MHYQWFWCAPQCDTRVFYAFQGKKTRVPFGTNAMQNKMLQLDSKVQVRNKVMKLEKAQ